jgi:hypothetical protein
MPQNPTPDDSELPTDQPSSPAPLPDPDAPLSFVPHDAPSNTPFRIKLNRYGEMEEHELIKLLDSIEDQVSRARFRESVYISIFVCCALALLLLYGPKYVWHTPQLISPADAIRKQEIIALNAPIMHPAPVPRPVPRSLDNNTLKQLREMTKEAARPAPIAPPSSAPPMPSSTPSNLPSAPQPNVVPSPTPTTPRVPNAPLPEMPAPSRNPQPNFNTPSDSLNESIRESAHNRNSGGSGSGMVSTGRGAAVGGGVQILSDTQGVDFSEYLKRLVNNTYRAWIPLLPEETEPPISKEGETYIVFTILPDGHLAPPPAMKLEASSHDTALDKAAWGSLVSQGQLPPLPSQYRGPGLTLRFHFMVNKGIGH